MALKWPRRTAWAHSRFFTNAIEYKCIRFSIECVAFKLKWERARTRSYAQCTHLQEVKKMTNQVEMGENLWKEREERQRTKKAASENYFKINCESVCNLRSWREREMKKNNWTTHRNSETLKEKSHKNFGRALSIQALIMTITKIKQDQWRTTAKKKNRPNCNISLFLPWLYFFDYDAQEGHNDRCFLTVYWLVSMFTLCYDYYIGTLYYRIVLAFFQSIKPIQKL